MAAIRVGSIIRLESVGAKGESGDAGFLYTLGWVTDIPVITLFHDPQTRALVTTYLDKKPATNTTLPELGDRWQILSADSTKQVGEELQSGDKIHLLNMRPGAGYLDTFEWVRNLKPFKDYPMTLGVFTSSVPNRGGGVSGMWTMYVNPQQAHQPTRTGASTCIEVNDTVYLKNEYPGAGCLFAYAADGKRVYENEYAQDAQRIFAGYTDAQRFVFTGQTDQPEEQGASAAWKITCVDVIASLYRIEQQWGSDAHAPWHDAGIFQIGDGQKGRVVSLQLSASAPQPKHLTGAVTFEKDATPYDLAATPGERPTSYTVTLTPRDRPNEKQVEAWVLGSREFQTLTALAISADATGALTGHIQYQAEQPIRLRATQGTNDDNDILYDFFHPDMLKGRTQKMQGVIDTTYGLLADAIETFGHIEKSSTSALAEVDFDFQKAQLDNLLLVSEILNAFYTYKLSYLMKQSFKNHRTDQTLAPLYLVRQSFQELATDYEIIQRATVQRQWTHGVDAAKGAFMSAQAMELLIMDKLAIASIAPFKALLSTSQIAIISYLSEETHIRHLPYTDQVMFIGVSYDSVPQEGSLFDDKALFERPFHAFELMAIPHEIGHYIYARGKLQDGRTFPEVAQQFAGNNPYYPWCEELFADVYGCVVTGPLTVLGMRALLVSIDREKAWKDDAVHPTPVLRVFILNEMLRILNDVSPGTYDFSDLVARLDEDWAGILDSWGYAPVSQASEKRASKRPARMYLHDASAIHLEQIVNIDRVIHTIRPIIVEFATHLHEHLKGQHHNLPWVEKASKESTDDTLKRCNDTMRANTNRTFGGTKASDATKLAIAIDRNQPNLTNSKNPKKPFLPDELLRDQLLNWGDHGPTGSGRGTY